MKCYSVLQKTSLKDFKTSGHFGFLFSLVVTPHAYVMMNEEAYGVYPSRTWGLAPVSESALRARVPAALFNTSEPANQQNYKQVCWAGLTPFQTIMQNRHDLNVVLKLIVECQNLKEKEKTDNQKCSS